MPIHDVAVDAAVPVTGVPDAVMVELDCTTDTASGINVGPGTS